MKADSLGPHSRSRTVALATFAGIAVILMGLGYWQYRAEKEEITRVQWQTLAAIGNLKAKQIHEWRKERMAEVERAAKDPLTIKTVSDFLMDPGNQVRRSELQECLRGEVTGKDSGASLIFDTRENLLASTEDAGGPVDPATRKALHEALVANKSGASDFFRSPDGSIHIEFAAPVPDDKGQIQALLILRHDAESYLYPLLQEWPTSNHSGETLLVQRDGNEVVFLSKLRHRSDPSLSLRHPLADTQMPAVQAVLGRRGIFEGKDYRGVDVVCALLPVSDSPWFITAKVDAEDLFSAARYRAGVITLIVVLLILLAAGVVACIYRQRQTGILNNLVKAERQKVDAQERELKIGQQHRTILQTAIDGFAILDAQGRIREVNDAYCRMTGYSEQELLTMCVTDLEAAESKEETTSHIQQIIARGLDRFESRQRRKDGEIIDVEVSVQFKAEEGGIVSFLRDITEHKKNQMELLERDRKLRESKARYDELARQIPAGIYTMRLRTDGSAGFEYLSEKLCQMLGCEEHEGLRDPECVFGTIHPDDRASLDEANRVAAQNHSLFRWEGRSLLWGKMGWVHIESEPTVLPNGDILWNGVVSDITERKQTEEALRDSEERFSRLFKSMEEGFFLAELIFDPSGKPVDWRFLDVNPAYTRIMGLKREDVIGRNVRELFPGLEDFWFEAHTRCALTGEPATLEGFVQATGRYYVNHLHSPCRGQFACIFTDITERKQAGEALRASEEQFRSMFEMASHGMGQANPHTGQMLRVNQKMCEITGYPAEELLKLRVEDITHPDDRQANTGLFKRAVQGDEPSYRMEKRYVRKDGSVVWVNVNMIVIRDATGSAISTVATIEDITARKQADACRRIGGEILHGLLQSDDVKSSVRRIVATLKKEGGFDAVGVRMQEGEDFPYAFQEGFPEGFLRTENSLAARGPDGGVCRDKDGKVCLECTCGLVIAGKTDPSNPLFTPGGSCWTNDSLSLPRTPDDNDPRLHPRNQCIHFGYASVALIPIRTQERIIGLIQINDHRKGCFTLETVEILEGVAGYIGETLMRKKIEHERNEALLRAEAAAAAKSEFLGVMSHELRTPLNGVLGFSELLSDTALDDEQKSYTQTIRKSGEHLLAVVNDILDFSSIEKGVLAIREESFAVVELVNSSGLTIQKAARDKGIGFHTVIGSGVPERISGDELRIRQILINLLGNAVKFTSIGSVTLQVTTVTEGGGELLAFSVEDTGIGMVPGTIGVLFQPFTQAEMKMSRTFGGTGLGLAISQRLAEAMGGKITVTSTPGKGSVFTFRLPLKVPIIPKNLSLPAGTPAPGSPVDGAVLVVDDDSASGVVAVKLLQKLGYHAELVTNGAEAVAAFVPGRYSHILMDIAMPVMDGLSAVGKIREIEATTGHHVPITAFTANVMPGDRERCLAAGMDDFLAKPFKRDELAAKIARANLRGENGK